MNRAPLVRDGFPGQRLRVLPQPLIEAALLHGPTQRLLVTDAGYFPRARLHGRRRPKGAAGAVVIVCTGGRGWCDTGARTTALQAGQALVIPPRRRHFYWADKDRPWTIWWLHASGEDVPALLTTMGAATEEVVLDLHDIHRATAHIERAVACLEHDESRSSLLKAAAAGWSLLAELAADALAGTGTAVEPVHDAQEYLRMNLGKHIAVPALAARSGLSASHFSALFRRSTGGGVLEYVRRLRMARARELLVTTSWPIAQIAQAVGYQDAFYFSRQFRGVSGCSPSQYRQQADHEEGAGGPRTTLTAE